MFKCTVCGDEILGTNIGVDGNEGYNFGLVCKKHDQALVLKVNYLTTEYCKEQLREEFTRRAKRNAEKFYDGLFNDE